MNVEPTPVLNAASLSLFMTAVSARLLTDFRRHAPHAGVIDLKAVLSGPLRGLRGQRYAHEALKLLPHSPQPILLSHILAAVTHLGRIHPSIVPTPPL